METSKLSRPHRRKVISQLDVPRPKDFSKIQLDIHLNQQLPEGQPQQEGQKLYRRLTSRTGTEKIKAALTDLLKPRMGQETRDREGELQPQVPRWLRDRVNAIAAEHGPRKVNQLVRRELARWIDFGRGTRKRKLLDNGKRRLRPLPSAFVEQGLALVREPDLVRFTFNAGSPKAKRAIKELIDARDINMSLFFSVIFERICAAEDDKTADAERTR
jgi:hypothetical protein